MQKETIGINKSLMALRKVINGLVLKGKRGGGTGVYIPYRESKLTSVLRQSLGGNSWSLFIACLSPSDDNYDENLSTLQYATKASTVTNVALQAQASLRKSKSKSGSQR